MNKKTSGTSRDIFAVLLFVVAPMLIVMGAVKFCSDPQQNNSYEHEIPIPGE